MSIQENSIKLSEIITILQDLQHKHGDIQVFLDDQDSWPQPIDSECFRHWKAGLERSEPMQSRTNDVHVYPECIVIMS
jgi:hypothetical protein